MIYTTQIELKQFTSRLIHSLFMILFLSYETNMKLNFKIALEEGVFNTGFAWKTHTVLERWYAKGGFRTDRYKHSASIGSTKT